MVSLDKKNLDVRKSNSHHMIATYLTAPENQNQSTAIQFGAMIDIGALMFPAEHTSFL